MKTEEIKKPTPADFRRPEVVAAALAVLACRAAAETTREAVDKIGQALLDTTHPLTDDNGERITKTRFAWRAYSGEGWQAWHAACAAEERKAGLRPQGWDDDLCPALVAEADQRNAEARLCDISGEPFGVTHQKLISAPDGLAKMRQWIELGLHLALNKGGRK